MKLVRSAVLVVGFGVVGLLGMLEWALRRRDRAEPVSVDGPGPQEVRGAPLPPLTTGVVRLRAALVIVGVLITAFGGYVLLRDVAPASYLGLALWLVVAVVLHDAVLAPTLTILRAAAHRAGRRIPGAAVGLAEAGFLVGGAITLLAVPEIWAKHLGTRNPTVLPGSYGQALLATWLLVVVVTGLAVVGVSLQARRHPRPQVSRSG